MLKNKKFRTIMMAAMLVALLTPLAIQLNAALSTSKALPTVSMRMWTCSDIPVSNCMAYAKGCAGDVMVYTGCNFWCQTGETVSREICCHRYICL